MSSPQVSVVLKKLHWQMCAMHASDYQKRRRLLSPPAPLMKSLKKSQC
jgi:hypothetical protein